MVTIRKNKNDKALGISDCLKEDQNPLDFYWFNLQESIMISNSPTSEELSITPGEGKNGRDQFLMTAFARS